MGEDAGAISVPHNWPLQPIRMEPIEHHRITNSAVSPVPPR
jgi:hypothetical protein